MKRADIARLLPEIFQRTVRADNPLGILLELMEQLQAPAETTLAELAQSFNPYQAPDAFVAFLATWVDLTALLRTLPEHFLMTEEPLATGIGHLRHLVASAAYLSQWRGTRQGLLRFLTIATGVPGFQIDEVVTEQGHVLPYHIQVIAPAATEPYRSLLERIIDMEKPAYITYTLIFR
jgi:phage tail-like protein